MSTPKLSKTLLPLCGIFACLSLYGQSGANSENELYELSPFTVDASGDVGYKSTSSLAGTRLNTNLRDIAASITVLNEEFLEDNNANTIGEALMFAPNAEISGPSGNFSGYQSTAGSPIPETETDRPQGGNSRIRGLSAADLTRNYFVTEVPFDTFNTDRLEVQRGANSALFGIGSPGGIVNTSTIKANLYDNFGRLRLETDEHGTMRSSFRYNKVLVEDKLAIRIAALYEDREYEQRQAFLEDERFYGSVVWKLTDNIRISGSIESGERHGANPDMTPINDGITPWIEMGKPITMGGADAANQFRGKGDFSAGVPNSRFWTVASPGSSSGFVSFFNADQAQPIYGGNVFVRKNRGAPGGTSGEMMMVQPRGRADTIRRGGTYPNGDPVAAGTKNFFVGGFLSSQIIDTDIFDYRKELYTGGAHSQNSDWQVYQGSIEGSWFDNRLGFEFSTYEQKHFSKSSNPLQGKVQRSLFIDPNMYLLDTANGQADGALVPNPHFGKPVMGGFWQGNNLNNDRKSNRLTGYGEIRFDDFMNEGIVSKALGRLKLTGLMQGRVLRDSQSYGRYKIDPTSVVAALQGDTAVHWASIRTGSQFEMPHNSNINYLNINSLSDLKGANIGGLTFGQQRDRPVVDGSWRSWSQSADAFVGFDATTFNMDDNNNIPASFYAGKGLEKLDSVAFVGQHYLWNNSIVLTGTWRNDRLRTKNISAPGGTGITREGDKLDDPTFVAGPQDPTVIADEDTTSWSTTVHLQDLLGDIITGMPNISLYHMDSDNFQPKGGRVSVFNEPIDSIVGSTKEKGIIYTTDSGVFSLRFNKFETGILNNSFDAGGVSASEAILLGLARELDNSANVAQGFTASDAQAVLPPQGVIDVNGFVPDWANAEATTSRDSGDTGTQDFTAEGYELELTYNPSERWTTMVGVAEQETVLSNIYPRLQSFVNEHVLPKWVNSSFAKNYYIDDLGTETLADKATSTIITPVAAALTQEGIPSIEQRQMRINLNTSYNFGTESDLIPAFMGNFTVGGGYRWQDKVGIGFGLSENAAGNMAYDPKKPNYGGKQDFVDLFFRSEYMLNKDRSLSIQLNVKDLLDNDDLVPIYANPDGTKLYRFMRGRLITVSATFGF